MLAKRKGSQLRHSTSKDKNFEGRTKPILSPDYIVGLVDGEGCFYVNIPESKRYQAGARVELSLHVKMQASDFRLLQAVKRTMGCGAVYFQKEQRPNHSQCYRYTVASHHDILKKIIPFFSRHQLQCPSKCKNFKLFKEIVIMVKNKEHLTEEGISKIRQLKKQMNQRTIGLA